MFRFTLKEIEVEVTQKEIKNLHLSVYPPDGRIRVSAPTGMKQETIRAYLISKLGWIRKQQKKIHAQEREARREYIDRESHFFRGKRYLLKIEEDARKHSVEIAHNQLILHMSKDSSRESRKRTLNDWYRHYLKEEVPRIIKLYEPRIGVEVKDFGIKLMKTRWGTCNSQAKRIWINLELAKKPPECLEYIVVHEMLHILEPSHNERFISLIDFHMPKWREYRDKLNRLPVGHGDWKY